MRVLRRRATATMLAVAAMTSCPHVRFSDVRVLIDPYVADERTSWISYARFGLVRRTVIGGLCKSRMKLKRRRPDPPDMAFTSKRGGR